MKMQNVPAGRRSGLARVACVREADMLLFYSPGLPDQGTYARCYQSTSAPNPLLSEGEGGEP